MTLVEVLVVVAILAILGAVLLPAINRARSAGRRTVCANNLRQMALALATYESAHGVFPAAISQTTRNPKGIHSAFVHLLPYIDQDALYNSINFAIPTEWPIEPNPPAIAANATAMATRLDLFLCPSDLQRPLSWTGPTNYVTNLGPSPWYHNDSSKWYPGTGRGAFALQKFYNSGAFRDGLEYTVAISERLKGDGGSPAFDRRGDVWYPIIPNNPLGFPPLSPELAGPDYALKICSQFSGVVRRQDFHFSWTGYTWFYGDYETTYYNHVAAPNSQVVNCGLTGHKNSFAGSFPARSYHADGVNVAMMGGSVRFVNDRISLDLWRALSTRAANDLVSEF